MRDGDGCLALVVPRGEGGAAGEEGLHAPRVSSMGGDVQRRVARAVRFGDVHVAGDEDGAQNLGVAALRGAEESHPEEGGSDGGGDVLGSVRVEKVAQTIAVARSGGGDDRGAVRAAAAPARHRREKKRPSLGRADPDSSRSDATHARADDRDDETRDDETTETTKRPRGTLTRALSRDAPGPRPRARSDERHPNPGSAFVPPGARMKILLFVTFMSHRQHRRSVAGAANVSPRLSRRAPTNGRATSPLLSLDSARDVSMF